MPEGLPGLAGVEHVGLTVPDLDAATAFFVGVLGCVQVFEAGPFRADDNWMAEHLNVHPRAEIRRLRMVKCGTGPALELFEYVAPDQARTGPANSDVGGHHVAFYVEDMATAVRYLRERGVRVLGEPTTLTTGPSAGLTFVYFLAPWGLQLELVSYPRGLAYEAGSAVRLWRPPANSLDRA
jgi:catechol 2,3-dioxygenase-like lactoylglutathione lyase family enzyme